MSQQVMLPPGKLWLGRTDATITTILGSCVSFTMRHEGTATAGICHCLLPTVPFGKTLERGDSFNYLDRAFAEMLRYFAGAGVRTEALDVKLFGGADVLQVLAARPTVGHENIACAKRLVAEHGIRLLALDVGGHAGRKIFFSTAAGQVKVRKLKTDSEQSYCLPTASSF